MTSTAQRLLETARTLPEPLLAQVLDFAEYLRARQAGAPAGPDRVPRCVAAWTIPPHSPDRRRRFRSACAMNGIDYLLDASRPMKSP